ncbi:MAG: hypothetical protein IPH16_22000 [Haliscomenobacter sp.]|nr:hypothetical protein [Haliscomenobacter sp.]
MAIAVGSLFLVFLLFSGWHLRVSLGASFVLFLLPTSFLLLAVSFQRLLAAKTPSAFRQVSLLIKLLMVTGLLSLLFVRF